MHKNNNKSNTEQLKQATTRLDNGRARTRRATTTCAGKWEDVEIDARTNEGKALALTRSTSVQMSLTQNDFNMIQNTMEIEWMVFIVLKINTKQTVFSICIVSTDEWNWTLEECVFVKLEASSVVEFSKRLPGEYPGKGRK